MTDTLAAHCAIVSRPLMRPCDADQYLVLTSKGPSWTSDARVATAFDSMREAARAALHLPAALRAFGVPAPAETQQPALHQSAIALSGSRLRRPSRSKFNVLEPF